MMALQKMRSNGLLLGIWCLATTWSSFVTAVMPTGKISLVNTGGYTYCAPAEFGPDLPSASAAKKLLLVKPTGYQDGCSPTLPSGLDGNSFALLVSRGNCSFETKAMAASKAGASALVIYNSLEGTYFNRSAVEDKWDYECANGKGYLSSVATPLWSSANDVPGCSTDSHCASRRCLVTNVTDAQQGREVCCAWDVYITMGGDASISGDPGVPTVFVTMRDSDALLAAVAEGGGSAWVTVADRTRPWVNLSSFLIWAMGVGVVMIAAWSAAGSGKAKPKSREARGESAASTVSEEEEPPAVDLSVGHTVGFIVTASCFLILLFYVDLNAVIAVMYCISAGSAVSTVLGRPVLKRIMGRRWSNAVLFNSARLGLLITGLDFASTFVGLGMALWWYLVRSWASYAWVLQDIMGASLCILFLTLVRFPNIKVATVLLSLAFFYDIFFVFLSPLIFHESVMIKVATGGAPKADATYCEKYPSDRDCRTREELPMLLVLPRLNDYQGGYTMLGLGDIILPGLLVAFAARYDVATGVPLSRGYYRLMVWGYAIGLMMANLAVYLMEMGQPALLYLVPCTLGTFVAVSYREGTLQSMWDGPAVLLGESERKTPSPTSGGRGSDPGGQRAAAAPGGGATTDGSIVLTTHRGSGVTEEEPLLDL